MASRRPDLDRLRTIACLTTFCYHAIQIFDLNPYYHIKSNTPSAALDVLARLLHAVRMPLFFLIAGMVGFMVLQRSSNRRFLKQRAWRLLPPFAVGIVFLTPWIKYFEVLDGRSISWHRINLLSGPLPDLAVVLRRYFTQLNWFSWSHMWFPLYLFLLGALLLPVMRRMAADSRDEEPQAAAVLVLPLAVFVAVELNLRPYFPFHIPNLFWDWASLSVYATCLVWGAALICWPGVESLAQRWFAAAAVSASIGAIVYVGVDASSPIVRAIGRALWLWSLLLLAVGARPWLSRGKIPGERYLIEGALPIYVLHHVPLVGIGYLVKDLPWSIGSRYALIAGGAFSVTIALYHILVRPYDAMRIAFGMEPRSRRPLPAPA
jgi:glucans biosynthesis protein C